MREEAEQREHNVVWERSIQKIRESGRSVWRANTQPIHNRHLVMILRSSVHRPSFVANSDEQLE